MDTTLRVSGLLSVADGIGLPRFRIRIGDEIVASRMGDGGGHEITHLRHRLAFRHADMHEHAGFLTSGNTMGGGILLAGCAGDHHLDVTAFESLEFFGDVFLQRHKTFESVLHHVMRNLLHLSRRRAGTGE